MSEEIKVGQEQTCYKFEKEASGWGHDVDNYVIPRELTVTITLSEYRTLLTKQAKSETDKMQSKLWDKEREVENLKQEVERLACAIETLKSVSHKDGAEEQNEN